jgi:RimJ/RimL family protein N-acetyltransferase
MASEVPAITSERLELVSLSVGSIEALLGGSSELNVPAGWPDAHDARFLRMRGEQLREEPAVQEWLARAVVLRTEERPVIGLAGFHGPPGINEKHDPAAVELGYRIFPPYRRRGFATEVVRALMDWASATHGITRFVASVAPDNEPSLAIVQRLGFVETGRHWDDPDGPELEFELDLADPAR